MGERHPVKEKYRTHLGYKEEKMLNGARDRW